MIDSQPGPVVAGVDHSRHCETAVGYAAREAHRRGLPLRLVHGFHLTMPYLSPLAPPIDDTSLLVDAERRLLELAEEVRRRFPMVHVSTKLATGSGGMALVAESSQASLVVVGSRGHGGFARLLLGSVASQVVSHAACPVIVVRQPVLAHDPIWEASDTGTVLVGIDGSPDSEQALDFAFAAAAARGAALEALHVWGVPEIGGLNEDTQWSASATLAQRQMQEAAERVLAEAMAGWREKYPQVNVAQRTVQDFSPAQALLASAHQLEAGLIVVGSRGRGGFATLALGSVSQAMVAHADRPVAVVHPHVE